MGLSASQARLLTLTSRQHAVEYKAQKLQAQKLQLANDSDKVYQEYLKRLDAVKIQHRNVNSDGSMYFDDSTFAKLAEKKFLFNVNGTICIDLDQVKEAVRAQGLIRSEEGAGDLTAEDSYTLLTTLVNEGIVILMEISDETDGEFYYKDGKLYKTGEGEGGDEIILNFSGDDKLFDSLASGNAEKAKDLFKAYKNTSTSTSTNIQEISDEKELKKAEALYESDMNKINAKDARYDTELSQLETERNAIKSEIDTLKTIANDNVERTFKLFT